MKEGPKKVVYNLEERTQKFGEMVINFCRKIEYSYLNRPLINQLIRSGTSIGANYMETAAAESTRDFRHKIGIAKKESKETQYWLKMITRAMDKHEENARCYGKKQMS